MAIQNLLYISYNQSLKLIRKLQTPRQRFYSKALFEHLLGWISFLTIAFRGKDIAEELVSRYNQGPGCYKEQS